MNDIRIGGADVSAKSEANMKDQVFCKDVGKCSHHIGVVLDLSKAGFGIIRMDDYVVMWVGHPQVVRLNKDILMHMAELTLKLGTKSGCH